MNRRVRKLARFIDNDLDIILLVCVVLSIVLMFIHLIVYSFYNLFTLDQMPEWCGIFTTTSVCLGLLSIVVKTIAWVVREVIKSIYHF